MENIIEYRRFLLKQFNIPLPQFLDWLKGYLVYFYYHHFYRNSGFNANSIDTDRTPGTMDSGPEVIKLFSCSTQLSMKFVLLINLKLLTIANYFLLNIAEHENLSANKYENANYRWHFHIY